MSTVELELGKVVRRAESSRVDPASKPRHAQVALLQTFAAILVRGLDVRDS